MGLVNASHCAFVRGILFNASAIALPNLTWDGTVEPDTVVVGCSSLESVADMSQGEVSWTNLKPQVAQTSRCSSASIE